MRRWSVRILMAVLAAVLAGVAGYAVYWANPMPAGSTAAAALRSSRTVSVTDGPDQIIFMPAAPPRAGFIFYQGARVAPAAYAATMHAVAEQGFAVFLPKLPLNMALLGSNAAAGIIAANPAIKVWAVGGHSLGGVGASLFAANSQDPSVKGLIFYASYPASSLAANTRLAVLSISASNDGLATPQKVAEYNKLLPPSARYVVIQGGDHAQFGDYGPQAGDNPAAIDRELQQQAVVAATIDLLRAVEDLPR
jgi:hypothetical protein